MDILDEVLGGLDLRGAFYFRADFHGAWGASVPELPGASRFHLVLNGRCRMTLEDGPGFDLAAGDLILVPGGRAHTLTDSPGRPTRPLATLIEETGYDGQGVLTVGATEGAAPTRIVCGHFTFHQFAAHPIIAALPAHILLRADAQQRHAWLGDLLRLIGDHAINGGIGSEAAIIRLSETLFIEILRAGLSGAPDLTALVAGFSDPRIGRALSAIHRDPCHGWTLDALASKAGMSRSSFAAAFHKRVGAPPAEYLANWRLQTSLSMLADERNSVQEVAVRSGYASPAAFSRAFSRKYGVSPSEYRIADG